MIFQTIGIFLVTVIVILLAYYFLSVVCATSEEDDTESKRTVEQPVKEKREEEGEEIEKLREQLQNWESRGDVDEVETFRDSHGSDDVTELSTPLSELLHINE